MKKTYAYHKPSESAQGQIKELRESFSKLHEEIEQRAPKSRELSVALTKLEESAMWAIAMWAIKAIVCNDPESTTPEA